MASSNEKGNISPFMLLLAVCLMVYLLFIIAQIMVFNGVPLGQYKNPNVATRIVEGNVYDKNGKTLSMQVPVYSLSFDLTRLSTNKMDLAAEITSSYIDKNPQEIKGFCHNSRKSYLTIEENLDQAVVDSFKNDIAATGLEGAIIIEKKYKRSYPSKYHASQLIYETEKAMSKRISPRPGYNTSTTTGDDVYLTLDIDIQYLLDMAVSDLNKTFNPDYIVSFIVDAKTGALIACSNYPFWDINNSSANVSENCMVNRAYISEVKGKNTYYIEKIVDNNGKTVATHNDFILKNLGITADTEETLQILEDSNNSILVPIPALENPKYYLFIGIKNPQKKTAGSNLSIAANTITAGLKAQSKI